MAPTELAETVAPAIALNRSPLRFFFFFFFNDTATTEIYTLSLHDALPISGLARRERTRDRGLHRQGTSDLAGGAGDGRGSGPSPRRSRREEAAGRGALGARRSEEHTSELQSQSNLVCRLLLEKKKKE